MREEKKTLTLSVIFLFSRMVAYKAAFNQFSTTSSRFNTRKSIPPSQTSKHFHTSIPETNDQIEKEKQISTRTRQNTRSHTILHAYRDK